MIKKVDGKYKFVQSKPEVEPNASRREMAMALAGIVGASAFLKGCATQEEEKGAEGSEENLSEAISDLKGTLNSVLWVDTYDELKALPGSYGTKGPAVAVCRDPLKYGVFIWTTDVTTPESIMVFPAPLPPATRTGAWKRVHSGPINVQWFGAVGNNSGDQSAAIQAAINELTSTGGGDLYFPPGYYRVEKTINIGAPIYDNYTFALGRNRQVDDPIIGSHQIQSRILANKLLHPVSLLFDEGAFIVAAIPPTIPDPLYTPVIAYNLGNDHGTGVVRNLKIIPPNAFLNGKFEYPPSVPATNFLIGLFANTGCGVTEKALFVGLYCGMLTIASYWCAIRDLTAFACCDALNIAQGNSMDVSNVTAYYCNRGIVFDGTSSKLMSLNTEEVDNDMVIFAAECCTFGPAYFEDLRVHPANIPHRFLNCGVSSFLVSAHQFVINCVFDNLRMVGQSVNGQPSHKHAMALRNTRATTFLNSRIYEGVIDSSTNAASSGAIINCDFEIPGKDWTVIDYKAGPFSRFGGQIQPGSNLVLLGSICYPFTYNFGDIGAGQTNYHLLPDVLGFGYNAYAALVQVTGGGSLLINMTAALAGNQPKVAATNPTSNTVTHGVVSGNVILHVYETYTP